MEMKPNDTDKKVMPEPSNLGAALSLMSSGQGWGGQRRENNVHTTKEERDQWRERLSSPYTCFNAAHADFTIRLLDALEEVEAEKERLELEADWLATKLNEIASPCRTLHPCEVSPSCNYPDGEPRCWRDVAHKAVEEGR